MLSWLICSFISLITSGDAGWTTRAECEQFEADMKAAGKTGHVTNDDPQCWEKHLAAMNEPQPDDWLMRSKS